MKTVVLIFFAVFRLINLSLMKSWFVPDEIFQSVEVAYRKVFGVGHLTWEWSHELRSFIHPGLFAFIFYFLWLFGLDNAYAIIIVPRLLHALLFAYSDYCYYNFIRRLSSTRIAQYSLITYLSCWFVCYCAPRTLSNSLETSLTLIALDWYPVKIECLQNRSNWIYIAIAMLAILIRPTTALLWIPFGIWHLLRDHSPLRLIFFVCLPTFISVLFLGFLLDALAYGRITFSPWNFVKFNIIDGGCSHFGTLPWHWYISQGLISTLGIQMFLVIGGIIRCLKYGGVNMIMLFVPGIYLLVHSLIAHKEHRFLLPIIPFLCIYSGYFLANALRNMKFARMCLISAMVLINFLFSIYMGLYHQIGPFETINFIRDRALLDNKSEFKMVQLMPCYSIPQYSHFHGFNVSIRALDCSPNIDHSVGYVDESDRFHNDALKWVLNNKEEILEANYIVAYEWVFNELKTVLYENNFELCARIFHSHFLSSSRQDNYIIVGCRK